MSLIKINETKRTRSVLFGRDLYDEYRKYDKTITFMGIPIWSRGHTHNLDYSQATLATKSVGFRKEISDAESKSKD